MMTLKHFPIIIFLFFMSCGTTNKSTHQEIFPVVTTASIQKNKLQSGAHDYSFNLTNGKNWKMKISVPEISFDENTPLILALHWAGGNTTYQEYSDCLVFPALKNMNAIIIVPSSESLPWTNPIMERRVIHFIKNIIKEWKIDEQKILVTGYSNGGIGSWEYANHYAELFSAAIPIAGSYQAAKLKIPTYVIHGENDELFLPNEVQSALDQSIKLGSKIEYELIPDFSHFMGCAYVDVLMKYGNKVKKDLWKK